MAHTLRVQLCLVFYNHYIMHFHIGSNVTQLNMSWNKKNLCWYLLASSYLGNGKRKTYLFHYIRQNFFWWIKLQKPQNERTKSKKVIIFGNDSFRFLWHLHFGKPQGLGKICFKTTSNEQQTACYKWLQWAC